jgi:hypothetical protein
VGNLPREEVPEANNVPHASCVKKGRGRHTLTWGTTPATMESASWAMIATSVKGVSSALPGPRQTGWSASEHVRPRSKRG